MKLTFLGSAAAEGVPAVFCNCENCREARRLGGKNIRTRSQTLINDDLLIDLPADTYVHFLNNNVAGDLIKYMLITHSHSDHFYPKEFEMHGKWFAHNMREPETLLLCGTGSLDAFNSTTGTLGVTAELIAPFETKQLGNYVVTALPARHAEGDGALFYIIENDGKTVLYGHDTGYFYEEVFDFLKTKGYDFDLISLDCTHVDLIFPDSHGHMGFDNIRRVVKRLKDIGSVSDITKIVVNHFSHNGNPIQERMEEIVKNDGYIVSYDGMVIEL